MATIQIRTAPRPQGNYQPFPASQTSNVLLHTRFPSGATKAPGRFVFWQGPVLADPTARLRTFSHFQATHLMIPDATNPMNLPSSQRGNFPGGGGAEDLARALAATIQAAPSDDPRKPYYQALLDFANAPHKVGFNPDAYRFFGYEMFKNSVAANGGVAPSAWGCDLEVHADKDGAAGAKEMLVVNVYEGARQRITELGISCVLFTYGYAELSTIVNHTNNPNDGDPGHMDLGMRKPNDMWCDANGRMDVTNAKTAIWRSGVYVGGDKYLRVVWDNASLYQKNSDGTIKTDGNGKALHYYGARTISNFGHSYPVYKTESKYYLEAIFSEADKCLAAWAMLCDTNTTTYDGTFGSNQPFPRGTGSIRAGMELVKLNAFFRDNAETLQLYDETTNSFEPLFTTPELGEEAANQRALYPQSIEFVLILRRMLYHALYIFSNEGNYADWVNGQANQHAYDSVNNTGPYYIKRRFGQFEEMVAAIQRGSNFPRLFQVMDAGKALFIIPWRPVYDGNRAAAEQQSEKPIVWGIKEQGSRIVWMLWCFPAQDVGNSAHDRTLEMWVKKADNSFSGSYAMLCKDRHTGFDQFLLPAGCENAVAEDFNFKFSGLLRGPYYRTGNYNVPVSGTPDVPARASSSIVTYTLPG